MLLKEVPSLKKTQPYPIPFKNLDQQYIHLGMQLFQLSLQGKILVIQVSNSCKVCQIIKSHFYSFIATTSFFLQNVNQTKKLLPRDNQPVNCSFLVSITKNHRISKHQLAIAYWFQSKPRYKSRPSSTEFLLNKIVKRASIGPGARIQVWFEKIKMKEENYTYAT